MIFILFLFTISVIQCNYHLFPPLKGIAPENKHLYTSPFLKCPTSGKLISHHAINDDYCDCPEDGFDEPATSACSPHGFFYCPNREWKPQVISTLFLNDGYCDCCDGSDEPPNHCPNTCLQLYLNNQKLFLLYQQGKSRKSKLESKAKIIGKSLRKELHHQKKLLKKAQNQRSSSLSERVESFKKILQRINEKYPSELWNWIIDYLTIKPSFPPSSPLKSPSPIVIKQKIKNLKKDLKYSNSPLLYLRNKCFKINQDK